MQGQGACLKGMSRIITMQGQGACLKGMSRIITMQDFTLLALTDVEKTKH